MSQEADDILRGRSHLNRHLYQQRIADAAEVQIEQSQPTSYLNFDATTGLARLQSADGNIAYGSAQTNGAIGAGENIRLRRGGGLARYDEMPHNKNNATLAKEIERSIIMGLFVYTTSPILTGINNAYYDLYPNSNFVYSFQKKAVSNKLNPIRQNFLANLNFQIGYYIGEGNASTIASNQSFFNILYYLGSTPIYILAKRLADGDLSTVEIAILKFKDYKLVLVKEINIQSGFSPEYMPNQYFGGNRGNYRQVLKYKNDNGEIKFIVICATGGGVSREGGFYLWELGSPGNHSLMGIPSSKFGLIQYGITLPDASIGDKTIGLAMGGGYGSSSGIVINCFFSSNSDVTSDDTTFSIFIPEKYLIGSNNTPIPLLDIVFSRQPDSDYWGIVNVGIMPPPIDIRDIIYPYFSKVGYFDNTNQYGFRVHTALAAWTIPKIDKNKTVFENI
ncbi:hypothetical protein [Nostoc sp.]|uniref:hypothetical protein n=1 Tax=Nostoc sp. TaxID=1180 RepID=UPI002FFAABA5